MGNTFEETANLLWPPWLNDRGDSMRVVGMDEGATNLTSIFNRTEVGWRRQVDKKNE